MDPLGPAEQHHTAKRQLSACWNKRTISSSDTSVLQAAAAAPELWLSSDTVSLDGTPFLFNARLLLCHPTVSFTDYLHPTFFTVN